MDDYFKLDLKKRSKDEFERKIFKEEKGYVKGFIDKNAGGAPENENNNGENVKPLLEKKSVDEFIDNKTRIMNNLLKGVEEEAEERLAAEKDAQFFDEQEMAQEQEKRDREQEDNELREMQKMREGAQKTHDILQHANGGGQVQKRRPLHSLVHVPKNTVLEVPVQQQGRNLEVNVQQQQPNVANEEAAENARRVNKTKIGNASRKVATDAMGRLAVQLKGSMINALDADKLDLADLAQFMSGEEQQDKKLVELYFGNNFPVGDEQAPGQDVKAAIDLMLDSVCSIDLSTLRLDDDAQVAANAEALEAFLGKMAALERMMTRNGYYDLVGDDVVKAEIDERLNPLRTVAKYYTIRKKIMTDTLYVNTKREDLSYDFTDPQLLDKEKNEQDVNKKKKLQAQIALRKSLVYAYLYGNKIRKQSGINDLDVVGDRQLAFANKQEAMAWIDQIRDEINGQKNLGDSLRGMLPADLKEDEISDFANPYLANSEVFKNRENLERVRGEFANAVAVSAEEDEQNAAREKQARKDQYLHEKAEERRLSREQRAAEERRIREEDKRRRKERARKDALLARAGQAEQNVLKDEGEVHGNEEKASEKKLMELLESLGNVDLGNIKFGSVDEVIGSYDAVIEARAVAESAHRELCRVIMSGNFVTKNDRDVCHVRAKIQVINALANYTVALHDKLMQRGEDFVDDDLDELEREMRSKAAGTDLLIVTRPGDIGALLENTQKNLEKEYAERDKTIQKMGKLLYPGLRDGEVPEDELARRMDAYSSNAVVADYIAGKELMRAVGGSREAAIVRKFCKDNGKDYNGDLSDAEKAGFTGMAAEEIKRLLTLRFSEEPAKQMEYWSTALKMANDVDVKTFATDGDNLQKYFDSYDAKYRGAHWQLAADKIGENIARLCRENENINIPVGYVNEDLLLQRCNSLHQFAFTNTVGTMESVASMGSSKFRHVLSLKEIGNMSDVQVEKALTRVCNDPYKKGEEGDMQKLMAIFSNMSAIRMQQNDEAREASVQGRAEKPLFERKMEEQKAISDKVVHSRGRKLDNEKRKKEILLAANGGRMGGSLLQREKQVATMKEPTTKQGRQERRRIYEKFLDDRQTLWLRQIDALEHEQNGEKEFYRDLAKLATELERRDQGYRRPANKKGRVPSTDEHISLLLNQLKGNQFRTRGRNNLFGADRRIMCLFGDEAEARLNALLKEQEEMEKKGIIEDAVNDKKKPLFVDADEKRAFKYFYGPNDSVRDKVYDDMMAAQKVMTHFGVENLAEKVSRSQVKGSADKTYYGVKVTARDYGQDATHYEQLKNMENVKFSLDALRQMSNIQLVNVLFGNSGFDPEKDLTFVCRKESFGEGTPEVTNVCQVFMNKPVVMSENMNATDLKARNGKLPAFKELNLPLIDEDFADTIMKMRPGDLRKIAGECMDDEGIGCFEERLAYVKGILKDAMDKDAKKNVADRVVFSEKDWSYKKKLSNLEKRLIDKNTQFFPEVMTGKKVLGAPGSQVGEAEEKDLFVYENNVYGVLKGQMQNANSPREQVEVLMKTIDANNLADGKMFGIGGLKGAVGKATSRIRSEFATQEMLRGAMMNVRDVENEIKKLYDEKLARVEEIPDGFLSDGIKESVAKKLRESNPQASDEDCKREVVRRYAPMLVLTQIADERPELFSMRARNRQFLDLMKYEKVENLTGDPEMDYGRRETVMKKNAKLVNADGAGDEAFKKNLDSFDKIGEKTYMKPYGKEAVEKEARTKALKETEAVSYVKSVFMSDYFSTMENEIQKKQREDEKTKAIQKSVDEQKKSYRESTEYEYTLKNLWKEDIAKYLEKFTSEEEKMAVAEWAPMMVEKPQEVLADEKKWNKPFAESTRKYYEDYGKTEGEPKTMMIGNILKKLVGTINPKQFAFGSDDEFLANYATNYKMIVKGASGGELLKHFAKAKRDRMSMEEKEVFRKAMGIVSVCKELKDLYEAKVDMMASEFRNMTSEEMEPYLGANWKEAIAANEMDEEKKARFTAYVGNYRKYSLHRRLSSAKNIEDKYKREMNRIR